MPTTPSLLFQTRKMKVEIISKELIKPSSPTPSNLKFYKLSSIDLFIPPSYVPLLLYYSNGEATTNINQSNMSSRLKSSLSETLAHFYPLAGRLTEDQGFIDCSDQGVYYAEARVDSHLSDIIDDPNIEELSEFIPYKLTGVGVKKVEEQLAIQVNLFQCGGIVIGICISHRIADGFTFCTFIKAWANMAKEDGNFIGPVFNSASVFPPPDLEEYWPKLRKSFGQPPQERLVTKRFVFTASKIAALKAKVIDGCASAINPTRVEVLSALIWKCGIAVTGLSKFKNSMAFHVVNLRGRMVPPLEEQSFGNFFQMVGTSMVTKEDPDLGCLVEKLRAAFREIDSEYTRKIVGENSLQVVNNNLRRMGNLKSQGEVEIFNFSSWCRFPSYEADFGWGKPSWMSGVNFCNRNAVFLFDSVNGGIEVWVTMNEDDVIKFEQRPEIQEA